MTRALLAIVLLTGTALADDQPTGPVGPGVVAARLYKEGRYAEAAKEFIKAYELAPRPEILFNIAQSYRFAGDCGASAAYFRKFVDTVKDAPNLDKVQKYIEEMDACAAKEKPATPPPVAVAPAPPPVAVAPAPIVEPADTGATKRHVGIALGVVGVAAVVTGVYFTHEVGVAENDRTTLQNQCVTMASNPSAGFVTACAPSKYQAIDDRGQRDEALAIATYAIGGAAVAAGVALYVLGHDRGSEHVAVTPLPGGGYASVGYAF